MQLGSTAGIWEAPSLLSGEGEGGCWTPLLVLGPLVAFVPSPVCTFLTFVLLTQSLAPWVLLLLCHPGMCHFMGTQCEQDIPHGHPNVSRTPLSVTPT